MRENILVKTNTLAQVLQWTYDGVTQTEISKRLLDEYNVKVSQANISHILKNLTSSKTKVNNIEVKETPKSDAQDILYANRKEVVRMYKDKYPYSAIAKQFDVEEKDVAEFLSKRKKITPEQEREILYKYSFGATAERMADEYDVNIKSIEAILKKKGVITTSPKVLAKMKSQEEDEIKNELYSPEICKDFIKFINNLQTRYKYYNEDIERFDNSRNNIYHKLEISDLSQEEQLGLLSQIKEISVERRKLKDFIEVMQPVVEFLEDEENKKMMQTFSNIVGNAMNNLKKLDTRVYFLREEV